MVKPIPRVVSAILGGGSPAGLPSNFLSLSAASSHLPVHMSVPLLLVALICVYPVSLSPVGQSAILLLVLSVISLASPDSACLPAARPRVRLPVLVASHLFWAVTSLVAVYARASRYLIPIL